ncbi:MAG: prenyltransferase [Thermodesulfobacteriota bacterium]
MLKAFAPMSNLKAFLGPTRLPFLILTPVSVFLGLGTAIWSTGQISILYLVLILFGALSAHISVNTFNEYSDFKSGLDYKTERTPFSGGSGSLQARPGFARQVLGTALTACAISGLIGFYFLHVRGIALLPPGILGLLIVFAYTPWLTHHPFLCLMAPGLAFGPLMVMGTDFVLTGEYSWTSFTASLVPFFLVSDLLLLNQFSDVEADRSVGRKHLPIVIGRRHSSVIYGVLLLLAYLTIVLGVYFTLLPVTSLLGLGTVGLAVPAFLGVYRYADDVKKLMPYMGLNVVINVLTPVLVAIGLLVV